MRVGLVGCVKQKADTARPAQDLYTSALFRGRRAWVEQTCNEWWVLSAYHGLLNPLHPTAPYDIELHSRNDRGRRVWAEMVLWQLRKRPWWGDPDVVIELHAGKPYTEHGLARGIVECGHRHVLPTEGLSIGKQLQLYRNGPPVRTDCRACGGDGWLPSLPEGKSDCAYCKGTGKGVAA